jgi:TRAP-type C4-dicarboxylate transport system permease small subunit
MMFLNKISTFLNKILIWIGGLFLVSMILLACANIALRATWIPVRGTFELMGFFGAIVTAFALGDTQSKRGHIAVNVLIDTFPEDVQRVLNIINSTACMLFFGVATWQVARKATILLKTGEVTETLRIIYYPFTYAVAFGCAVLTLVFVTDLLNALIRQKNAESRNA